MERGISWTIELTGNPRVPTADRALAACHGRRVLSATDALCHTLSQVKCGTHNDATIGGTWKIKRGATAST